jgi:hypothetical protein
MGQEIAVEAAGDVGAALARLADEGLVFQVVMIDGQLQPPATAPPPGFRELRLRAAAGMVTVRRRGNALVLAVFGNADVHLVEAQRRLAAALAGP